MSTWFGWGLRSPVVTTAAPRREEDAPGVTPGRPVPTRFADESEARAVAERCPTKALRPEGSAVEVELARCIHCGRCRPGDSGGANADPDAGADADSNVGVPGMEWRADYQWARWTCEPRPLPREFRGSVHIRVVDAGDCGACLNEVHQLFQPHYSIHRLGLFHTPTPRKADILLVVGSGTAQMESPLLETFRAMPDPVRVVVAGACALGSAVLSPTFVSGDGVGRLLPVDVVVPGHPPPPMAILQGLLLAAGRGP